MAQKPIAILYEHPEWFKSFFDELDRRGVPYERLYLRDHFYDPAERQNSYRLIVNRVSAFPSGGSHPHIILYVKQYLAHLESIQANVINGHFSYLVGSSKALQLDIFAQLGLAYPRARVIHHARQATIAAAGLHFPVLVKPNVGGSGAGIQKFDTPGELAHAVQTEAIDLGVDHTGLVQEYLPAQGGHIVRVEILDGELLYALRVPITAASFNYCPADGCNIGRPGLAIRACEPPAEVIVAAKGVLAAARADLGSVEYLVNERDGRVCFYDVNPLSNFVADAPNVVGYDPTARFVDFILKRAGL